MNPPREQWGSRNGFVLATIGGAVGIGNIWRFSYVAGENGGAVFLFIYLAFVFLIGVPLMIAELAIGRHSQGDAISAFETSGKTSRWSAIGWLGVLAAVLLRRNNVDGCTARNPSRGADTQTEIASPPRDSWHGNLRVSTRRTLSSKLRLVEPHSHRIAWHSREH